MMYQDADGYNTRNDKASHCLDWMKSYIAPYIICSEIALKRFSNIKICKATHLFSPRAAHQYAHTRHTHTHTHKCTQTHPPHTYTITKRKSCKIRNRSLEWVHSKYYLLLALLAAFIQWFNIICPLQLNITRFNHLFLGIISGVLCTLIFVFI